MKTLLSRMLSLSLSAYTAAVVAGDSQTQTAVVDGLAFRALHVLPNQVGLHWKNETGQAFRYVGRLKKHLTSDNKTVVALMNAGIYGVDNAPAGLHIENGRELHALNTAKGYGNFHIQPNGVFLVDKQGRAKVLSTAEYHKQYQTKQHIPKLATQSGPMLVIDGKLNKRLLPNSQSTYTRNGVCITKAGELLFIATDGVKSNFYQFARASQQLGCHNTLYLDGSISKLYVSGENSSFHFSPFVGILSVTK